jgi:Endonuclease/Exonuclease/phosphatase family
MTTHVFSGLTISRTSLWFQLPVLCISTSLCLILGSVYWFQPDFCAALLVFPRWLWLVPGLLLALLALTRRRKLPAVAVMILWVLYTVTFIEETRSLARWQQWPSPRWQAAHERGKAIRVISLNCEGGNEDAAAEVISFKPDLILFQESPVRPKLHDLLQKLGPEFELLSGPDVSILVRGHIEPIPLHEPWNVPFADAQIEFGSGFSAHVIGARLLPYDIRIDLWSPECWQGQRACRFRQQRQIEWLAKRIRSIPAEVPLLVGGDFNMPGGDKSLRELRPHLRDSFHQRGSGWGDTLANNFPFLRVDQIWCSDHFYISSVIVRRTEHSDHRMVVCDFIWENP